MAQIKLSLQDRSIPEKEYQFCVAAIGAAGQGPWSDPATGMAV